tara:strand:- start:433 stop:831 length:399 start_codon:yes stop_codon:yes gene_type:complete
MARKTVMIEEISEDLFMIYDNSPLLQMIEFGYILHLMLLESEMALQNEWEEFAFEINMKVMDRTEDFILISYFELNNVLTWLDWICRVVVSSEGEHNYTKFIKTFLNESDNLFLYFNSGNNKSRNIIIEKLS